MSIGTKDDTNQAMIPFESITPLLTKQYLQPNLLVAHVMPTLQALSSPPIIKLVDTQPCAVRINSLALVLLMESIFPCACHV